MQYNEFWLNNPTILFKKNKITQLWPKENMNYNEKLNAISRFVILLSAIGYMCLKKLNVLLIGLITLGIICFLSYNNDKNIIEFGKENFENIKNIKNDVLPTENNPLMNVNLNDYKENPEKPPSALISEPGIPNKINEAAKENILNANPYNSDKSKIFKDLSDELEFEQSMRAYHTTANTTIPNDQKGFTEFCYGNLPSDKNVSIY
tara:strand:- start:24186 stop:24803 length:618 start_codon:yes stop_codon:yes gene_type:complete